MSEPGVSSRVELADFIDEEFVPNWQRTVNAVAVALTKIELDADDYANKLPEAKAYLDGWQQLADDVAAVVQLEEVRRSSRGGGQKHIATIAAMLQKMIDTDWPQLLRLENELREVLSKDDAPNRDAAFREIDLLLEQVCIHTFLPALKIAVRGTDPILAAALQSFERVQDELFRVHEAFAKVDRLVANSGLKAQWALVNERILEAVSSAVLPDADPRSGFDSTVWPLSAMCAFSVGDLSRSLRATAATLDSKASPGVRNHVRAAALAVWRLAEAVTVLVDSTHRHTPDSAAVVHVAHDELKKAGEDLVAAQRSLLKAPTAKHPPRPPNRSTSPILNGQHPPTSASPGRRRGGPLRGLAGLAGQCFGIRR
jgi:hypothetical protein